jgi:predicted nucleic acid-binding protein
MSNDEVRQEIATLESFLSILEESIDVYAEWKRLVVAHGVSGVQVHDARIVAAMNVYGVTELLTFNVQDFRRFIGIKVTGPEQP